MELSLSVILPVKNSEHGLAQKIREQLEVLADLTTELEFLIVDDGWKDGTEEIVLELCRQYPQVNLLRHSHPLGHLEMVEAGLRKTTGDVVIIHHDVDLPIGLDAIRRFWATCDEQPREPQIRADPPRPHSPTFVSRGTQILRRDTLSNLCRQARSQSARSIRADVGKGEISHHANTRIRAKNP